jgi:CRISPR-associated protein Csb2
MPDMDNDILKNVLAKLSSTLPVFHLPKASYSYLDIFANVNISGEPERKEEIFDAFVVVDPSEHLYIKWDAPELTDDEMKCLSELLNKINFLGRSESWVKMELSSPPSDIEWNSYPSEILHDSENTEEIKVAVPVSRKNMNPMRQIKDLTGLMG